MRKAIPDVLEGAEEDKEEEGSLGPYSPRAGLRSTVTIGRRELRPYSYRQGSRKGVEGSVES